MAVGHEPKVWDNLVHSLGCSVRDIKSKIMHCTVIHRYYWTPVRLKRLGPTETMLACMGSPGAFIHLLRECPRVWPFWMRVVGTTEQWLDPPLLGDKCQLRVGLKTAWLH